MLSETNLNSITRNHISIFNLSNHISTQHSKTQYDQFGCLKWLNEFGEYYNHKLQSELDKLRVFHPRANIIYADYYNAALPLYRDPTNNKITL